MKRADVRFKCVVPDRVAQDRICVLTNCQPGLGVQTPFANYDGLRKTLNMYSSGGEYIISNLPEISWSDAIQILESCEENQPKSGGEWYEYFISDGRFLIPSDRGDSYYEWQNHCAAEINTGMIFGGWNFEGCNAWTTRRLGKNITGQRSDYAQDWAMPLIPTKIRFWKENK
ncbi:hypothetical protein EOM81_11140 [bacterium]|nr:hypothetical protein [bacterium]